MDAHEREYAAAVNGMAETYGHKLSVPKTIVRDGKVVDTYAVGDRIKFLDQGRERIGVVVEVLTEDTYHCRCHQPDHGSTHHAVTAEEILPF